ncbi:MAG: hypothetical protein BGO78_15550 [Chloroflexi bacterium 44-23]|nr:MAG: hypothetical protein BGO78_15550 [Chloroflexi bacterium 44-23]
MSSNYQLVIRKGANPGQTFPIDLTEMYIGRDLGCEIVINDTEVSRRHAKIYVQGSGFVIEDLGSTNGTFVNGQRITGPHVLVPGEEIALGDTTTLLFEVKEVDPDATRVAMPSSTGEQTFVNVQSPPNYPAYSETPVPAPTPPMAPMQSVPPVAPAPPFAGQVPPSPSRPPVPPSGPPKKKSKTWIIILVLILFVICACVAVLLIIDSMNLYCNIAPGLMNSLFGPATCP